MSAEGNPTLQIRLFGRFGVTQAGLPLDSLTWKNNRKTQTVLKILLTQRGQPFTQDQLIEFLYPDTALDSAIQNLYKRISELRKALEPDRTRGADSLYILGTAQQGYCFNAHADCWLDTDAFTKALELAQAAERAGQWSAALDYYQQACALYTGDFLAEDLYEEWAAHPREHFKNLYLQALTQLGESHARLGQYAQAIAQSQLALGIKSTYEIASRQQMIFYCLLKQPNEAQHVFDAYARALQAELGVAPSAEMTQLMSEILTGKISHLEKIYPPPAGPATHNLPHPATSFVGRERERYQLRELLATTRLLTLTGAGGSGKTRLALQLSWEELSLYPHGAWWIELAPIAYPELVIPAVAIALGVKEQGQHPLLERVIDYLKNRQLLLILDNCEHLTDACAGLAATLLKACPNLQVLATSREALGVDGELTWAVPPLALPSLQGVLPPPKILQHYEAIGLFIERALFGQPRFEFSSANAEAVVQICQQLDGLPLAIELAASRVKLLSPQQIAQRLSDRFKLLTSGSKTGLPHHQTLKATMDWSYELLSLKEQALLRRLSVFVGGWTLEAAEQVSADEAPSTISSVVTQSASPTPSERERLTDRGEALTQTEILDLLSQLVDKSLVIAEHQEGTVRYRMLETVREYSAALLESSDSKLATQDRHTAWFTKLVEEAATYYRGPRQAEWLERLEREHGNLRAVWGWSISQAPESSARLAASLGMFWFTYGHLTEGRAKLDEILKKATFPVKLRAELLNSAGNLAWAQGDISAARGFYEESLALQRELGNERALARSLVNLAVISRNEGDYATAQSLYEEGLSIARKLDDPFLKATILTNLGVVSRSQKNDKKAQACYEEALTIAREIQDVKGMALTLHNLASLATDRGNSETALKLDEESLLLSRQLGDRSHVALVCTSLGNSAIRRKDFKSAAEFLQESLSLRRVLQDKLGLYYTLISFSLMAEGQQRLEEAARLMGAAESLRESLGHVLAPPTQQSYKINEDNVRTLIGEGLFTKFFNEGRTMSLDQAIEYAAKNND
jgi:predicted ATPase/DNA-binding SARP family transcriptional activator